MGNFAIVNKQQAATNFFGKIHFVRDYDHGHAFHGQILHNLEHLVAQLGVKRRCGFVKQHEQGLDGQCTGDGNALLLAA